MAHLDEATALGYAAGALRGDAFEAALAHIDACAECRMLVASAAGGRREAGVPATIGRFTVEDVAGRGAMGVVYRARDPRLERAVAIKTLRGDAFAGEARARFEREARALARIDHPNVVKVYEVGELDGELFIAMELVVGRTLQEWLAAAPRRVPEIVAVFVQAAEGLLAAHQAGLVHRDFKPSNAMVDADGRVRVTDFGLVHLGDGARPIATSGGDDAASDLTQTGMVLGTPAYLAPELFLAPPRGPLDSPGAEGGPEPRSDQFSLCVALFEALAGHRPFEANDLLGLRAAIDRGPLPPRRPIPRAIHRALRRGLAVAPPDRFPSLRELIDAITPRSRTRTVRAGLAVVAVAGVAAIAWAASPERASRAPTPTQAAGGSNGACPAADARWERIWTDQRATTVKAALVATWPATPPPGTKPQLASRWAGLGRVRAALGVDAVRRFGVTWGSQYREVCLGATSAQGQRRRCLDDVVGRLEAVVTSTPGRGFSDQISALDDELDRCASHLVEGLDVPSAEVRPMVEQARADLARAAALRAGGELTAAAELVERAVATGTSTSSPSLLAEAWLDRGLIARDVGEVPASIDAWHTAIGFAQQVGHYRVLRRTADELAAQYALGAGDRVEGERWLRTAAALDGKVPPTASERATRLLVRGELARTAGDRDGARELLTEAQALVTDAPDSPLAERIHQALTATR